MKCLILGAGATAFCDIANSDRRPPLINESDFKRMFLEGNDRSVTTSPFGISNINPFFIWAIETYKADLEEMFTDIFYLSLLSHSINSTQFLEEVKAVYNAPRITTLAQQLNRYGMSPALGSINAKNMIETFSGIIRDEILNCLGTKGKNPLTPEYGPISKDHRLLAQSLSSGDCVINYNYDDVMGYALLNEGRICRDSFKNSAIKDVIFQNNHYPKNLIQLITPHGSFSWRQNLHNRGSETIIAFGDVEIPTSHGALTPLILPFKCKDKIINTFPIFKEELELSLSAIKESEEIVLIGKQFYTGDNDLVELIKEAASHKKKIVTYVDPSIADQNWLFTHNKIFNASSIKTFSGVQEYILSL